MRAGVSWSGPKAGVLVSVVSHLGGVRLRSCQCYGASWS